MARRPRLPRTVLGLMNHQWVMTHTFGNAILESYLVWFCHAGQASVTLITCRYNIYVIIILEQIAKRNGFNLVYLDLPFRNTFI